MTDETNLEEANFWFSAGHVCGYLKRVYGIDMNFREDDTGKGGIDIECSGFKDVAFRTTSPDSKRRSFVIHIEAAHEKA